MYENKINGRQADNIDLSLQINLLNGKKTIFLD